MKLPLVSLRSRRLADANANAWWAWGVVVALLSGMTVAALVVDAMARRELLRALDAERALASAALPRTPAAAPDASTDFTSELPPHPDVPAVLAELQRACAAAGVTLQEIRVDERKPSLRELGLAQLTLQWRGSYPNIKQALAEVQERFASLTLRQLGLHRSAPPSAETQGTATLAIWARPLTGPSRPAAAPERPTHGGA